MSHQRSQITLLMVHDPSDPRPFAFQEHYVKRTDAAKWITNFKRAGFKIIRVNHNVKEI